MPKHKLPRLIFATSVLLTGSMQLALASPYEEKAIPQDNATNACQLPTKPATTPEETAWQLFVAVNCKVKNQQLTWETWKTQACLNNPADCNTQRLHKSMLSIVNTEKTAEPNTPRRTGGCSPMTTASTVAGTSLAPFVPSNLSSNPQFCEEVTINPSEETYAKSKNLLSVAGQINYLQSDGTINFPTGAVEVKADWVAASSYDGVTFNCNKPNTTIYQEIIGGTCYALSGIHISSKLYKNWLWATFEPQDPRTNPNRCNPNLYNACVDTWGSDPAQSQGENTKVTPALTTLFTTAGTALDTSFQNYRLTGVQTDFNQPTASNGKLGSSFVEFNAQVPAQQASCITCHSYAQRTTTAILKPPTKVGSTPPGSAPTGDANIGNPTPLNPAYKPLDFSWFLGFGVPKQ